jgi:hypothetical protein
MWPLAVGRYMIYMLSRWPAGAAQVGELARFVAAFSDLLLDFYFYPPKI